MMNDEYIANHGERSLANERICREPNRVLEVEVELELMIDASGEGSRWKEEQRHFQTECHEKRQDTGEKYRHYMQNGSKPREGS